MNHTDNLININSEIKDKKEESSDEESFEFFKESKEQNFLNNKRKISEENYIEKEKVESINMKENNNSFEEKEKEKSSTNENNNNSISIDEEQKVKKNKKKKKKQKKDNKITSKSKQICQFYINGACKKGDKCPYSHDAEQIHKKELCKFFLSGKCNKGEKCLYSHDLKEIPCKFIHGLGFCENFQNCPFSHERLDEEGIINFIKMNEDFLRETKKKYGRTNMDDFYNKYIKEKEGGDQYIMLPDFIKKEEKENENNDIPLGFIVMNNNNKIINQLKICYNMQNFQNKTNSNFLNEINNNINNNTLNFGNNQSNNINKSINTNITPNINFKNKNNNKSNHIVPIQNNMPSLLYQNNIVDTNKNIENKIEKKYNENIINNKNNINLQNNKKGKIEEENKKNNIPQIDINPFMNPMMISNNDINNLF